MGYTVYTVFFKNTDMMNSITGVRHQLSLDVLCDQKLHYFLIRDFKVLFDKFLVIFRTKRCKTKLNLDLNEQDRIVSTERVTAYTHS